MPAVAPSGQDARLAGAKVRERGGSAFQFLLIGRRLTAIRSPLG
jgi:hypothetical protein